MASKSKRARIAPVRNLSKHFLYWALAVFIFKLLIIFNIEGGNIEVSGRPFFIDGSWLGADGENYLKGYDALQSEGIFSDEGTLNYWPAGYPLVILSLSLFGKSWVLTTLSILQSAVYSWSVYLFASQIFRTKLSRFSYIIFLFIILNPTLSLSSIAIGYESFTASGFLCAMGLIIKDMIEKNNKKFFHYLVISSFIFGLLVFMQPRLIIAGLIINFIWILFRKGVRLGSIFLILSLVITLFFPATLIYRNNKAVGVKNVSTNLGVTMNIGAGDAATGGYTSDNAGVECEVENRTDNDLVKCVLKWYVSNPTKSLKLFYNKTIYFWSPWFGPEANGTMGRNPWLTFNPIKNIASTQDGYNLVFGGVGQLISWIWLLGGVIVMFYGFVVLWRLKSLERFIATLALVAISTTWAVSLISIGDHRFRIPIMGLSLFLQAVGLRSIFSRGKSLTAGVPTLR
jgi:hypothetical protein